MISPFSINSFASASVCARLEPRSSSIVTGVLSGSASLRQEGSPFLIFWLDHRE
jgi:hypothetical protein